MGVGIGSGRSLENVHSESDTIGTVDLPQAMPFPLPVNHKFTCVALENVSVDRTLRDPIDLGDGIWILFEPPFPLDHAWREWLGSIRAQNYERTNLALIAHAHSARPVVLDHANEALRQPVLSLCYALFLIDVFHHDGGLIISGANVDGTVNIRQVAHLETLYRPNGVRIARLDRASLLTAVCVAAGMRVVHAGHGHHERLRKGFHAWLRGVMEYNGEERQSASFLAAPVRFLSRSHAGVPETVRSALPEKSERPNCFYSEALSDTCPSFFRAPTRDRDARSLPRTTRPQMLSRANVGLPKRC